MLTARVRNAPFPELLSTWQEPGEAGASQGLTPGVKASDHSGGRAVQPGWSLSPTLCDHSTPGHVRLSSFFFQNETAIAKLSLPP